MVFGSQATGGPLAELSGALKLNDVLAFICQIFSLHICSDYRRGSVGAGSEVRVELLEVFLGSP